MTSESWMDQRSGSSYYGTEVLDSNPSSPYQKSEEDFQTRPASMYILGGGDDCKECGKRVYEMEKVIADQVLYHKTCFKCTQCKRLLNTSTYASMGGVPYCKPHFMELFKPKGQYDVDSEAEQRIVLEEEDEFSDSPPALPVVQSMKGLFEIPNQSPSPKAVGQDASSSKWTSKWDKSSDQRPPTPVNRVTDDGPSEDTDILPPADITRNLVAMFRSIEQGATADSLTERKAVRQFTPPRESPERSRIGISSESAGNEEAARDVVRATDKAETEEELPPPRITKNLVAKFKSLVVDEDAASTHVFVERQRNSSDVRKYGNVREECVDGDDATQNLDAVEEMDSADGRDLPEAGMAQSLVAQWKTLESQAGYRSPSLRSDSPSISKSPSKPTRVARTDISPRNSELGVETGAGNAQEREAVEEEDGLPPPDITRNLLARFKTFEAENQTTANQTQSKKPFKWDVKEAKPVNYPGLVTVSKGSYDDGCLDRDEDDDNEEELAAGEDPDQPHPAYAKIMLDKFRDLEQA